MDERELYETDRPAWINQVSPRMAKIIADTPDTTLPGMWARMPRDYQTAVWALLPEAHKQRIRMLRSGKC
jgi:hypothetical protein